MASPMKKRYDKRSLIPMRSGKVGRMPMFLFSTEAPRRDGFARSLGARMERDS